MALIVEPDSVEYPTEFAVIVDALIVLAASEAAVTDVLVVSVDTVRLFEPRLLTFIELTETALVHVSALPAPLVNK